MRVLALLLLSLFPFGSRAEADAFASSDLHPLLRAHAVHSFQNPPNLERVVEDRDFFVSRGGALLHQVVSQVEGGPFMSFLVRGAGAPAEVAALKQALADGRVGTLTDCEIPDPTVENEPFELTWYGREGRRNSFVAVIGTPGASGLPACPPQVLTIIGAIGDFRAHVLGQPGTETLFAP